MNETWVLIHGGWGGPWQWTPVIEKFKDLNIPATAVDMPGMGKLEGSSIDLSDFVEHASQIIKSIKGQVNIAAFSFGGMTATALVDRFSDKINTLLYVDAFVPEPGQSFASMAGEKISRQIRAYADVMSEGEMIPPFFEIDPRYRSHPLNTLFSEVVYNAEKLKNLAPLYIECTAKDPQWTFTPLLERMAKNIEGKNWKIHKLNSDHMPMYSHTDELISILTAPTPLSSPGLR